MTELRVEGLVHEYPGGVRALDGVDLVIRPGQRVALVGQNGSGKTTLVRHLNGLLRPTAGRVLVDGVDARTRTVAQLSRTIALAFQDPETQVFSRSVRAEVAFGPRNLGLRGDALDAAVGEALQAVGLSDEATTNPFDLGPSRRKLLTLAAVTAMGTPVVVFDEPTTGQDFRGTRQIEALVAGLAAGGRTVIAISHDLRFVAEQFERIVVLRDGRILLDGPPEVVFARSAWDALRSTWLQPPLPAIVGDRLGLGPTPTDDALLAGLGRRAAGQQAG